MKTFKVTRSVPTQSDRITIKGTLEVDPTDGHLTVWADCTVQGITLDRPRTSGISVGNNRKLGERLVRAINAGVVFYDICVRSDIHGQTYVAKSCRVSGRTLNADLNRMGY